MEVTITGDCPRCRRRITLHEHIPAEWPKPGDAVIVNGNLCVAVATDGSAHRANSAMPLLDPRPCPPGKGRMPPLADAWGNAV